MDRTTRECRLCGRPIYWDHGFKTRNFREHEIACGHLTVDQRAKSLTRVERARPRRRRRRGSKNQLELQFEEQTQQPKKEKPE